ncbi:MAG: hypothetical protein WD273_01585 [Trueperaceae bacterium]
MTRLTEKLKQDEPTLCISLIDNDAELARAVQEAGADGLKLHTNLAHGPTGRSLGGLERELDRIEAVLAAVDIPVGIVPRGRAGTTREEVERLRDLGFDFVDLYGKHTSPAILTVDGIGNWVAATADYTAEMLSELARRPGVDVVEAAFLPVDTFGSPLSVDDLVRLQVGLRAIQGSGKPLVLPTDRKLELHDLPALLEIGVRNYLLGYAVTGDQPKSTVAATERFRKELDSLAG